MSETLVAAALDELVPEPGDAFGDWTDVLRRAGIGFAAAAAPVAAPRRRPRRPLVAFAFVALLLVVLFATPAFGLLRDLIGRTNVPFTGRKAPVSIQRNFFDMGVAAPAGMSPEAIAGDTRRVGVFHVHGKTNVLYVAPTRKGGFCWVFSHSFGGCRASRSEPHSRALQPGELRPYLIGAAGGLGQHRGGPVFVQTLGGDLLVPAARTLTVEYEDGTATKVPFIWVSKPVDAGFFLFGVPTAHERAGARVDGVSVRDAKGRLLARQVIVYAPLRPIIRPPQSAPPHVHAAATLPTPRAPLQQGSDNGVSVAVGSNRIAAFTTSGASPAVKPLLPRASYVCFKFTRYHETVPLELGFAPQAIRGGSIPLSGLAPPYDGCEVQAAYGRTWPDRFHSHAVVEIAFSARARRFFADRAAARDLSLYVRSRKHHGLEGIRRIAAVTASLPPDTIGYVRAGAETTYVERSTTGRRFQVAVRGNRVVRENVKTYTLVF